MYEDDAIAGNCLSCGDRIIFNAFPGGSLSLRTRQLLEQFILEGEPSSYTLEKLLRLKKLLKLELDELDVVRERIEIIQDGVRSQLES